MAVHPVIILPKLEYALTIVVRHLHHRVEQFTHLMDSLARQSVSNFQVVILNDDEGRGVEWANGHLAEAKRYVKGAYVWILDDDDILASDVVVEQILGTLVYLCDGGIVANMMVFQFGHNRMGTLPNDDHIDRRKLDRGRIAGQCVIVDRWLFDNHIHAFGLNEYPADYGGSGDYSYITRCREQAGVVLYIKETLAYRQYQSLSDGSWQPQMVLEADKRRG